MKFIPTYVSSRKMTIAIACTELIGYAALTVVQLPYIFEEHRKMNDIDTGTDDVEFMAMLWALLISFLVCLILVNTFLIYGALNRLEKYIFPALCTIFARILAIIPASIVATTYWCSRGINILGAEIAGFLIAMIISVYCWFVVYAFYKELQFTRKTTLPNITHGEF